MIAIEPIPDAFDSLKKNVELNELSGSVQLLNIGLGSRDAYLSFSTNKDTVNHVLANDEYHEDSITVPVRTLDSVLMGKKPRMIKIDVEGYETEVLNGARKTLADSALEVLIIELNGSGARYGYKEDLLHQELIEIGYSPVSYCPKLKKFYSLNEQRNFTGNTIYIKGDIAVHVDG